MYKQSPNQYIIDIINKHRLEPISLKDPRIQPLLNIIYEWGGNALASIKMSGSSAKGTALKGSADLDLFVSMKDSTAGTLKDLYESLFDHIWAQKNRLKLHARKQNVSIRVFYKGFKIDIVPGKKLPGVHNRHSIYVRRDPKDRTETNIDHHISLISNSGRTNEIIALKIWRDVHKLDFPSIYLELLALEFLSGKHFGKIYLERNFYNVLDYFASNIVNRAVYDPVNTSNVISYTLKKAEKQKIQRAAAKSLTKPVEEILF